MDNSVKPISTSRLVELLDQGANAIYVTDAGSGRFVFVNDRACETLGYSKDKLLGKHISEVEVSIDSKLGWTEFVEEVRDNPRFTIQSEHRHKDGTTFPVEVDLDFLDDDGRELVLSVIRPLNEREAEREEIIESYSQYYSLFKHSPIPLWHFDLSEVVEFLPGTVPPIKSVNESSLPDREVIRDHLFTKTKIIEVNHSTLDMLEVENEKELFDNFGTVLTDELKDELVRIFEKLLLGEFSEKTEMHTQTLKGEELGVRVEYSVPPEGRNDLSQVFVSIIDITARRLAQKRAERRRKELEQSEKQFRQMAENIEEVFYNYKPDYSEALYVSPAYEGIWERDREELYRDPWAFGEAIHDDDRDRVLQEKETIIENDFSGDTGIEYRIVTPDGTTKWIQDVMFPVREDGEIITVVGYCKEITEKKRAQENLKQSLREKKTLLEEIHHRVKNNLQIVTSLLSIQSREIQSQTAQAAFDKSIKRINAMALIHEKLYGDEHLTELNFETYLRDICEHLVDFYGFSSEEIEVFLDIDRVEFELDRAIACGLIVNELVNNSLEHGVNDVDESEIRVQFRHSDNQCRLSVSDNGPGMDESESANRDLISGLDIITALVEYELDGEFTIDNSNTGGFSAQVNFELCSPS